MSASELFLFKVSVFQKNNASVIIIVSGIGKDSQDVAGIGRTLDDLDPSSPLSFVGLSLCRVEQKIDIYSNPWINRSFGVH